MKILFICEHSPFKSHSGAHQRTSLLCNAFSKIAYIDVLTFEQDADCNINNCTKIDIINDLKKIERISSFLHIILLFFPPIIIFIIKIFNKFTIDIFGRRKYLKSKIISKVKRQNNYDYIIVRGIDNIRSFGIPLNKKVILDIDDLPEQFYKSRIELLKTDRSFKSFYTKQYFTLCAKVYSRYTRKVTKKLFVCYLPNENLCSQFANTVYLPNIPYNLNIEKPQYISKYQILFVGVIEYSPNYIGIEYFLDNIYPLIVQNIPEVNFNIVGSISKERRSNWLKKYKNTSLLGFVDDLNKLYLDSSVVVVPIYNGSGTNIKVIEAMSKGKACVISPFAGKGFENILIDGKNIYIADSCVDFAEKTIKLLKDENLRETIADSAKKAVDQRYSFEYFSEIVKNSISVT